MISNFNSIVEIQGVPCDECMGAGFVMLNQNGDVEVLACDCPDKQDEYIFFEKEND
jgi:hypothetical protein